MHSFATLIKNKDLLYLWTMRTIKARYQQSILGGLWAIIQPAATVTIFSIIFTFFVPVNTGGVPYVLFSYTAMVPWTLFSTSIADMVDSLVINMNLVSKIYFPREILPIAASMARLLDFAIASGVIALFNAVFPYPDQSSSFAFSPDYHPYSVVACPWPGFTRCSFERFLPGYQTYFFTRAADLVLCLSYHLPDHNRST